MVEWIRDSLGTLGTLLAGGVGGALVKALLDWIGKRSDHKLAMIKMRQEKSFESVQNMQRAVIGACFDIKATLQRDRNLEAGGDFLKNSEALLGPLLVEVTMLGDKKLKESYELLVLSLEKMRLDTKEERKNVRVQQRLQPATAGLYADLSGSTPLSTAMSALGLKVKTLTRTSGVVQRADEVIAKASES